MSNGPKTSQKDKFLGKKEKPKIWESLLMSKHSTTMLQCKLHIMA